MSPLFPGWDDGHTATDLSARKGRYGEAYVRDVCSHFGVGVAPNSPDEDFNAIDLTIQFRAADTRVQVKCTSDQFTITDPHLSLSVTDDWVRKWSANGLPAYLIVVQVPDDPSLWVDYDADDLTNHATAAYWARVDNLVPGQCKSIALPRANRFTPYTLRDWNTTLRQDFLGGGAP